MHCPIHGDIQPNQHDECPKCTEAYFALQKAGKLSPKITWTLSRYQDVVRIQRNCELEGYSKEQIKAEIDRYIDELAEMKKRYDEQQRLSRMAAAKRDKDMLEHGYFG